ncbi:LOW QUALITY PROTEIN: hypothetical protein BSKO_08320 [Bryopsis sp. KO-2023]|nr:LOW QUALITY PROTEIN: hypothetical protein BSKO_08320 [Bryopsis sp. KO-2023]
MDLCTQEARTIRKSYVHENRFFRSKQREATSHHARDNVRQGSYSAKFPSVKVSKEARATPILLFQKMNSITIEEFLSTTRPRMENEDLREYVSLCLLHALWRLRRPLTVRTLVSVFALDRHNVVQILHDLKERGFVRVVQIGGNTQKLWEMDGRFYEFLVSMNYQNF